MGSPNQLSFLPDDYLERKAARRTNAICAVLFLVVIGGVGSVFTISENATKAIDKQFANCAGAKVLRVGEVSADEAVKRAQAAFSADNNFAAQEANEVVYLTL